MPRLEAERQKPCLVIVQDNRDDRGMFAMMDIVLGNLFIYTNHAKYQDTYSGFTINFKNQGYYYSKDLGENWWDYYFAPIAIGEVAAPYAECTNMVDQSSPFFLENFLTKEQVHTLITNYLVLQPEISRDVDTFARAFFADHYVVGIHYRGTDKVHEAPRVSYEQVAKTVHHHLQEIGLAARLFIATDEQAFIDFMIETFGECVIYVKEAERSVDGRPLHKQNSSPYHAGYYALLDALLLAQSHFLIRTSSNLSRWSTYFNPTLPTLELNQRYGKRR